MGERRDLEVYSMAVRTANGEPPYWQETPKEFTAYVERGTTQYLDGSSRKEALPVTFNYERWLGSSG